MGSQKLNYPKTLKDIPSWRQRQIEEDLRWFLAFSPAQRLKWADHEWREIRDFIERFGLKRDETGERS